MFCRPFKALSQSQMIKQSTNLIHTAVFPHISGGPEQEMAANVVKLWVKYCTTNCFTCNWSNAYFLFPVYNVTFTSHSTTPISCRGQPLFWQLNSIDVLFVLFWYLAEHSDNCSHMWYNHVLTSFNHFYKILPNSLKIRKKFYRCTVCGRLSSCGRLSWLNCQLLSAR